MNASKASHAFCIAQCNIKGIDQAVAKLKSSGGTFAKEKDPQKKAKLEKKYNDTLQFFMAKRKHYQDKLDDISATRKAGKGHEHGVNLGA